MKKSYLIALTLTLAIVVWMVAGQFVGTPNDEAGRQAETASGDLGRMTVEVRTQHARAVSLHTIAQGHVEPNRVVTVRAETAGRIAEVVADEGRPVQENAVLIRLDMNDRQSRLKKSEALVQEQQKAHARAKQLAEKGYQAQRMIEETFSELQSARADLAEIQHEIENTVIRAPFNGILEVRQVEVGDYVPVNGELATIVDNDPLVVVVQIAQQDIGKISRDSLADITFATGQKGEGRVRLIAPRADAATRTFRVEMEVANADGLIPSGTSAEARIPTETVNAQFISPALLTLNDAGMIGVKTVTDADRVEFHPVNIILAAADGVWVSGLPEVTRIITVGQGFVREGEMVNVALAKDGSASDVIHDITQLSPARYALRETP